MNQELNPTLKETLDRINNPLIVNGLSEDDKITLSRMYGRAIFPSPIESDEPLYQVIDPARAVDPRGPSGGDLLRGSLINDNLTGRLVWEAHMKATGSGLYRDITGFGNDPIMGWDEETQRNIAYTPDEYFNNNIDSLTQSEHGKRLLSMWAGGEFDSIDDSAHLAALLGSSLEEMRLEEELAKASMAERFIIGVPTSIVDPTALLPGLKAYHVASRGVKATSTVGRIAENVGQGFAISTIAEGGLTVLDEDREPAAIFDAIAANAAFDAAAAGIWTALFRRAKKISIQDLRDRAGHAEQVRRVVTEDDVPPIVREVAEERQEMYRQRHLFEGVDLFSEETHRFIPAYRDNDSGRLLVPFTAEEWARIELGEYRQRGWIAINQQTNTAERFITDEQFNEIRNRRIEEMQAERDAQQAEEERVRAEEERQRTPPLVAGLEDPIDPNLTLEDFELLTPDRTLTDHIVAKAGGTEFLSNFGLEKNANSALQVVVTRTFERIRSIKGNVNGRVRGFAPLESRLKVRAAQQQRLRNLLEQQVRRVIAASSGPAAKLALKSRVATETLSNRIQEQRRVMYEILELERLDRIDLREEATGVLRERLEAKRAEAEALGLDLSSKEFLAMLRHLGSNSEATVLLSQTARPFLGAQIDAGRAGLLDHYTHLRLPPESTSFDQYIAAFRALTGHDGTPEQLIDLLDPEHKRLTAADVQGANRNSGRTLEQLSQIWNEDLGGFIPQDLVPDLYRIAPNAQANMLLTTAKWFGFIDLMEAYTVYRHTFKELAQADPRFRQRDDVSQMLERLEDTEPYFNPDQWENGLPPHSPMQRDLARMLDIMEEHIRNEATLISDNRNGLKLVEKTFNLIRRQTALLGNELTASQQNAADIAGNLTRASLLTTTGAAQIADTATLMTLTSLNGVQGSLRQMMRGMMINWKKLEGIPAVKNAFLRHIVIIGEANNSFAKQRLSAADYEMSPDRLSTGESLTKGDRTKGGLESLAGFVSFASGTTMMNNLNKGGALMAIAHELTDPELGVIPKIHRTQVAMREAGGEDIRPYLAKEGVSLELADLTLRILNERDIETLAGKIEAGEFDEIGLPRHFLLKGSTPETIRVVGNPRNRTEAEAIEKLAQTVNLLIDRRLPIPGLIENTSNARNFFQQQMAAFLRVPMAVGTRMLVGTSQRNALFRFYMLMSLLGGATMVGMAKSLLNGTEDRFFEELTEHPARFVADRLAWAGAFGVLGEKMSGFLLDATSPDSYQRLNAGEMEISTPLQSVFRQWARGIGGVADAVFNGDELTQGEVTALHRSFIIGETAIAKSIKRIFEVAGAGDVADSRAYLEDALDVVLGVKEARKRKSESDPEQGDADDNE